MKEQAFYGVDTIVVLDGENGAFHSYMTCDEAQRIQDWGGLQYCENVNLRETDERKIPQSLKEGISAITDILVKLQPNVTLYLN